MQAGNRVRFYQYLKMIKERNFVNSFNFFLRLKETMESSNDFQTCLNSFEFIPKTFVFWLYLFFPLNIFINLLSCNCIPEQHGRCLGNTEHLKKKTTSALSNPNRRVITKISSYIQFIFFFFYFHYIHLNRSRTKF